MTNQTAPTMAELLKTLTVEEDLGVSAMSVLQGNENQPSAVQVTFAKSVKEIPKNLPKQVLASQETKPIVYCLQPS